MLAYNSNGKNDLPENGYEFDIKEIVPKDLDLLGDKFNILVFPLFYRDDLLGIIVYEMVHLETFIYEIIRGDISSAIHQSNIIEELREVNKHRTQLFKDLEVKNNQLNDAMKTLRAAEPNTCGSFR